MNINELYKIFLKSSGVSTDSRSLKGGELFFALKGENFDGNKYAIAALKSGAAYSVVDEEALIDEIIDGIDFSGKIIRVKDSLKALQELARWHRSVSLVDGKPLKVIALTGTNGKTTTKELLRAVLSTKYQVLATEGNLNNQIGVPLTLLRIKQDTELAIIEMGASHIGDISELVSIALPNYGLITNVGKAHLQGFGNFEGVMATKGELYDYLQRTADKVFLNVDNEFLLAMAEKRPDLSVIPYGVTYDKAALSEKSAALSEKSMCLSLNLASGLKLASNLVGNYNAENIMAALAVGKYFGISEIDAVSAISAYIPSNNRSQLVKTNNNSLIIDAYNANPSSMEAALNNFSSINTSNKVAMLGDMLELGEDSFDEHLKLANKAINLGLEKIYFVGTEFLKVFSASETENSEAKASDENVDLRIKNDLGVEYKVFPTSSELADFLKTNPLKLSTILIKGSRGIRMEKCLEFL